MFNKVNQRQSFPELEKEIISYWKEKNTFKKSVDTRNHCEEFNFYDGPPFATWTPHYWHILAWTIKDVVPRYQTMLWNRVERRFGWDCHWLPIEWIVEKKLWIKSKREIDETIWTFKFNEECRANVFQYVDEWKKSVERMWRWVDMENDYKTMDKNFMESVWWVFKNLYNKWLIYQDYRVVPYSVGMSTPLSNFEVNQWYKDKQDKTITVKFKVAWSEKKYILAWTTTPWTLASNLWLAVWENVVYVELLDKSSGETYILAKSRISSYYKVSENTLENDFQIVREYPGSCLVWIKYEPLYNDFIVANETWKLPIWQKFGKNTYSVVLWHHVTDENGTWVVHTAPAFWEDDMVIWKEQDLWFVMHIDDNWYTYNLLENNWVWVFDFNDIAIETMKKAWLSVKIETITHSYPHCWRTDVPLIYRAISAWYVDVEAIKDKMISANQNITWVPDNLKNGRFWKWLEWARDWNISRNRYWGSAIPVWQSEDKRYEWCVWSIEELYELNKDFGQIEKKENKYFYTSNWKEIDLHKHFVDDIKIKHPESGEVLKRIPEVLDCWFESWSMPYASKHYPFAFEKTDYKYEIKEAKIKKEEKEVFDFFIPMWKQEFDININYDLEKDFEYKVFYIKEWDEIVAALQSHKSIVWKTYKNWKVWDWNFIIHRVWVKKELRNKWYWADLLNKIIDFAKINLCEKIHISAEMNNVPYYEKFWFKINWENYKVWNNDAINMTADIKNTAFKFPADFIAEWIDQTRGWFYTLVVLWAGLFDKNPFNNVITNWIVLAEDGKKMSKRLQNYTDPSILMNKHGADAMRFYLMSSPVVQAEDMRFSDNWVEEVVKKVILPLWNTYSFFTTYANIDWFNPNSKKWNIFYVRHGQTKNNVSKVMNWWESGDVLNETWIKQAIKAWKNFSLTWDKIDKVYCSTTTRTKETLDLILKQLWYEVEIVYDDRLVEQYAWIFAWKNIEDIKKEYNLNSNKELRHLYKEKNWVENTNQFEQRVLSLFKEIEIESETKNILIVWHSGTFRPINRYLNNLWLEEAHYNWESVKNWIIIKLPNYKKSNLLDKYIFSELNKLSLEVSKAIDNYKLNEATKPIVKFMDNLTNWYIRRSRKRFWANGMTQDKFEAYNTLYDVLVDVCKIIAPYMPFVSEYIYTNLTLKESVHLDLFPVSNPAFILEDLSSDTSEVQDLITLWLSARANSKLRVRQPLSYIKITHELDNYYKDILKEELNIKEVFVFNIDELPKKICKPNARLIGPKFWQNVKFIMWEAKSWNFTELENGWVKVWEFVLEKWEFEIEYLSNDYSSNKNEAIESWNWKVISISTLISEDLKLEWFARDIVRQIQEARKDADFNVEDRIKISFSNTNDLINSVISKFSSYIETETLSIIVSELENFDFEKQVESEDLNFTLKLKN